VAIQRGTETKILITEERTWHVDCFCEDGTDYRLIGHRELLSKDANGNIISRDRDIPSVVRVVSQVLTEINALQMLGLIKDTIDTWAGEDEAARIAPPPPPQV
jgi:hypothetical protein